MLDCEEDLRELSLELRHVIDGGARHPCRYEHGLALTLLNLLLALVVLVVPLPV